MDAPAASITADGLRVEFRWQGDRFGHAILLVDGDHRQPIWQSVDADPDGPVFQELHEQAGDDGQPILFLSGAGEGAHWSMSVHREGREILFDVAARITRAPVDRSIQYSTDADDWSRVRLQSRSHGTTIDPAALRVTLRHALAASESPPTTARWKYSADR